jgi:hypothetical protein
VPSHHALNLASAADMPHSTDSTQTPTKEAMPSELKKNQELTSSGTTPHEPLTEKTLSMNFPVRKFTPFASFGVENWREREKKKLSQSNPCPSKKTSAARERVIEIKASYTANKRGYVDLEYPPEV